MIPKKAKQTLAYCIAQSIVVFGTAAYFHGEYFKKVLPRLFSQLCKWE